MDVVDLEKLLDNEREWRRFIIEQVNEIKLAQAQTQAWNLVFRVIGGALFTLLLALIEFKSQGN